MEKICGIYKITNPKGKIYIGQSINISSRISRYKNYHCKSQVKLYRSLKKYGWQKHKFEILFKCKKNELNVLEKYYIELYQCFDSEYGLNLQSGGGKYDVSKETREKLRKINLGHHRSGWKLSEDTKEKIRRNNTFPMKGKHHTEEAKEKNRQWHINRKASDETRKKMSIKKIDKNGRKIINIITNEIYNTMTLASKSINVKPATLWARLNNKCKNKTNLKYYDN